MVMLTFSVFDHKYPFWAHLLRKNKIFSLSWNLESRLVRICTIQWLCLLFLLQTLFASFMQKICWHFDVTWLISQKLNLLETESQWLFLFYQIRLFCMLFSFFYFEPLVAPLFMQLFFSNIYVSSKNKGADLMKTAQLFYFHLIPTV